MPNDRRTFTADEEADRWTMYVEFRGCIVTNLTIMLSYAARSSSVLLGSNRRFFWFKAYLSELTKTQKMRCCPIIRISTVL